MKDSVNIKLTKDEAIVLFEFLYRFNNSNDFDGFEDQAEQRVLWNIESILENSLTEPLQTNYRDILEIAREKNRDKINKMTPQQ